jgi:spore maturation protein CgeB
VKIYVVSDATKFALTDVYNGYIHALKKLNIEHETLPYHYFRDLVSDKICYAIAHSTVLTKSKEFTHVMFIGGLNIPNYILESFYHIKSIVVSTEDPHSSSPMLDRLNLVDYYFSNERSIGTSPKFKNVYYCPTAGSDVECGKIPRDFVEDKYKSDILFLGAMYPNRSKLLESIIPFVKRRGLSFKICGHVQYLPKKSPLWEFVFDARTIPHPETVKYYNGARVVLNILRDINWNPRTASKKNPLNRGKFDAQSLNPRAYEVPLCQAFMLMEDTRAEAHEIFTDNQVGFFSDELSLIDRLHYFLIGSGDKLREDMAYQAYKNVAANHTYTNRLLSIKAVLEKTDITY